MRRLLRKPILLLFLALAAGAVYAYQNPDILAKLSLDFPQQEEQEVETSQKEKTSKVILKTKEGAKNILGSTTRKITQTAQNTIKKLADEQEEALVNQTVENLSRQVKDLPERQVEKVKYEFCQDVIKKYEEKYEKETEQ